MNTRRYLYPNLPGLISVKSISQYAPGFVPLKYEPGFEG